LLPETICEIINSRGMQNAISILAKKKISDMGRIHKEYYSANARFLSVEAIKDIKTSPGRVPDAINSMAKKYRISYVRAEDYIENRERKQQMIYSHSSQPSILTPK
ncbi:4276_t:CDS:2, partial [Entrophospora sp. SA101]